jgi:uncharacterized DUF497 family protein
MTTDRLEWNPEKNETLKKERGLSFEDVETAIETGDYIGDFPHPNQDRYPNQRILIVEIDGYTCAVPYIRNGDTRFLKTIFRSRKLKRLFSKRDNHE